MVCAPLALAGLVSLFVLPHVLGLATGPLQLVLAPTESYMPTRSICAAVLHHLLRALWSSVRHYGYSVVQLLTVIERVGFLFDVIVMLGLLPPLWPGPSLDLDVVSWLAPSLGLLAVGSDSWLL